MISAQDVKSAINPTEFYLSRIPDLDQGKRHSGWINVPTCPAHGETSGFYVNLDTGLFKCHSCGETGDIISFAQLQDGVNFSQTLKTLCEEWHVSVAGLSPTQKKEIADKKAARELARDESKLLTEMHVMMQCLQMRVDGREIMGNRKAYKKFQQSRPEWRMADGHWQREVEAAGNVKRLMGKLYSEVMR